MSDQWTDPGTTTAQGRPAAAPPAEGDPALVARAGAGEHGAQRALLAAHGEAVWRLLYRVTGDYDWAHDLTQETFLLAFRKADRFRGRGAAGAWLARLALNLARDEMRKRRRRRQLLERRAGAEAESLGRDPLMAARVSDAVESLPEGLRWVVEMHDIEGYTHEEIAEALDIAPGSSRARLSRARARLREQLSELREEF